MDIAIIAPSAVPFVMGGAENLWLGLQRYINEETKHHCELFKIPTKENNLLEIVQSYKKFSQFDAMSFDKLLTGKYPSWMAEHPSHIIYMLHTLRGVYDTYHFCKEPIEFEFKNEFSSFPLLIERLNDDKHISTAKGIDFIEYIEDFISRNQSLAYEFRFPGPFSRAIIHSLDAFALNLGRISKYAAISKTVSNRSEYFPKGVIADVLYPPPRLEGYFCRRYDFIFTISRLDTPKRIDLLIESMKFVNSDIQLFIGGKGPEELRLKEIAAGNPRITFLGELSDKELLDYYSEALCVPFLPYDEDYGLVTIEAMKSAKPVITTTDSGGVLEFVKDHVTGLVVPPEPKAIASAIDFLSKHPDKAQAMGRSAQKLVEDISWSNVANGLFGFGIDSVRKVVVKRSIKEELNETIRPKMVVAVTFPIYPPRGGGQSRIYNLYKEWAKKYDVVIICLSSDSDMELDDEIAPGLREIRIPKSNDHQLLENEFSSKVDWVPVTDIVASFAIDKTPRYIRELENACVNATIVVASHPFLFNILTKYSVDAELWFEAQDVEYSLKESMLPDTEAAKELLELTYNCEKNAWKKSKIVFACTENDLQKMGSLYGSSDSIKLVVPNGFSSEEVKFVNLSDRNRIKSSLSLNNQYMVVFMGSWHGPNIEAVELIFDFAREMPFVDFFIVGSVGLKFSSVELPGNIKLLGVLNENEKNVVLSAADLAINPMTSGTGSNLKMLDYFAAGLPVMSTAFGARGINVKAGIHYIGSEINDFIPLMTDFLITNNTNSIEEMVHTSRVFIAENYSWTVISEKALEYIDKSRYDHGLKVAACEYVHDFAFFNKTYIKDAQWSLTLYASFERFAVELVPYYVVAPDHDLLEIKNLFFVALKSEEIKSLPFFVSEESILSCASISTDLVSKLYSDGNGWFVQQIVKLALGKSGLAKNYFTIDSACFFLRNFDYKKLFFSTSGELLTQASHIFRHDQYEFLDQHGELGIFQYNRVNASDVFSYIHDTVGGNNESTHWYTSTTGIFSSYAILKFEEFLFDKGFDGLAGAIYAAPYELTWYGEFVYNHKPVPFIPVDPSILHIVCKAEDLSSLMEKENDLLGIAFQPPLGFLTPNDIMQIVKNIRPDTAVLG